MSLLSGPDQVVVYPEVESTNGYGDPIRTASISPVTVTGRVQPISGTEDLQVGQAVDTRYRLLARDFPAGPFARVEWNNRLWDVDGEPLRVGGSAATAHVVVVLKARELDPQDLGRL